MTRVGKYLSDVADLISGNVHCSGISHIMFLLGRICLTVLLQQTVKSKNHNNTKAGNCKCDIMCISGDVHS